MKGGAQSSNQEMDFDNDQDNDSQGSENYPDDDQKHPEDELELKIMNQILKSQKKGTYEDKISEQLEQKLLSLQEMLRGKSEEQILNVRMHQLAVSKILVFTHGKSQFRLVTAHFHLGEAYLNYKCYQQAIDHLTIALKKNGKLFDIKDTKVYHSHILTSLGKCYYEIGSYDDALELLNKAKEIQSGVSTNDHEINSTKTLTLIANCYTKLKDFANAMSTIDSVLNFSKPKSQEYAMALVEKSKIFALEEKYAEAEKEQLKAIEILIELKYQKPEYVAELYQTMGGYQEKLGDIEGYQISLQKVKAIYQGVYSPTDKRVIKTKRQISVVLLKNERYKEALNELHETLALQKSVYGESSIQVAKTLKIIGTIYLTLGDMTESQNYLKRAHKIFAENGQAKNAMEIKNKLKLTAKDVREAKQSGKGNMLRPQPV